MTNKEGTKYDIALSFAGEDRAYAEALAEALKEKHLKVFYDKWEKPTLWGKDLYSSLSDLYQNQARFCVMLISENYQKKLWTNHERKAAQARAFKENYEYILPIRLDDTEIPGILPTIGYLNWREETVNSIADILVLKINPEQFNLETLNEKLTYHFRHVAGGERGMHRWFMSTALTIKNLLLERQEATQVAYDISNSRRVYYLSPEFLLGRKLGQAIQYLAMHNLVKGGIATATY